ncbi:PepSY domain-containing protein [Schumannella soli]|uniref:PepSY domain-containing protein n=1 Tax=Schumannella soli TaxID=2590779 RepID=A0A506Y8B7_9MICO|nr:PepSY domain-containing protein [Schumannella soli]TPW77437.1 PepSY domain-containing protein [Schumannella soli]
MFTRRTSPALIGIPTLLAAGLLLAGCSTPASTGGSGSGSSAPAGSSSATGTTGSAGASAGELRDLGKTALASVGAGTLVSIEQEDDGTWEALVVGADGAETELRLADGAVVGTPSAKPADAEDQAENARYLGAAKLDFTEAATKIVSAQAGSIRELNLDDHAGAVVWEADVIDDTGAKHSVRIDAASGAVVSASTGDSDDD